jgi:hypothetical protein
LSAFLNLASAGPLGASDDLPVQPRAPPEHHQDKPTIDLKDLPHLSQHPGILGNPNEGTSTASPSGFTIPVSLSDGSQGTNRSSTDLRCAWLSDIDNFRMRYVL